MRTCQVGTSILEVYAPRHIRVGSVYAHKKMHDKISEYEEDNNTMSILPENNQGQKVEQGVHLTSHCRG